MKLRRICGLVLALGGLTFLSACGGTDDENVFVEVAFTPTPTPLPIPKNCGNGQIDPGEQCDTAAADPDAPCGAGESCVCCLCLGEDQELGDRVFSVARPNVVGAPNSMLISSGLQCNQVSLDPWSPGPLLLRAGRPNPALPGEEACSASLTLAEDAILAFPQLVGLVCMKLFAEGSEGSIDCDGGTAHDVEFSQNSNGGAAADPPVITTGLGDPAQAGPGAATLVLANGVLVNLPAGPNSTCLTLDYDDPPVANPSDVTRGPLAFTTGTGTGILTNPKPGSPPVDPPCSSRGANFSCATWPQEDSAGTVAAPLMGLDIVLNNVSIGDTVNVLTLTDNPNPTTP